MTYWGRKLLFLVCDSSYALAAIAAKTYYDILQVRKGVSDEQIKRACRKLALKYHPDKNQVNEEANKRFADINNAYEVLSDSEKRSIYDRYGEEGLKHHMASGTRSGGMGMDIQDIFGHFFGGGPMEEEGTVVKDDDVIVELDATLEDLYMGGSMKGITKPQEVRKFKGEGMPVQFSPKKGDLYVTFEVLFPMSLMEDQKTKIRAILG